MFHVKLKFMRWIKIAKKSGEIVDQFVSDEFYDFINHYLETYKVHIYNDDFYKSLLEKFNQKDF